MPPGAFQRFWENLPDADDVFAYDTVKSVRVLDRRLGLVYYTVLNAVLFYIIIYVFMIEKKYQEREKSMGWVVGKPGNHPILENVPFDTFDVTHNPGEQGALFVPTRIVRTTGQQNKNTGNPDEAFCASPLHKCETPADCEIENSLLQKGDKCENGFCLRRQWCPAECDPAGGACPTSEQIDINPEEYEVRFVSNVHFHKFALDVSTTDQSHTIRYPLPKANTFKVRDLLRMANLKLSDISMNGALMLVNVIFDCELDDEICTSSLEAANVDSRSGFNYAKTHYYTEGGVAKRDLYRMFGIRIMVFATGNGAKRSFSMIVLQISSAIALLAVARTAADFFLEYVVPERRHYIEQKIIQAEHFHVESKV